MKRINIRYIYISSFCLLVCLLSSCKKYIYQEPINSTYDAKFWTSTTSVQQAVDAMYIQLRSSLREGSSFFVNGDLVSGTFVNSDWNYASLRAANSPAFNFSYVPYLEGFLQDWSRFYRLIAQTNLIIKNVNAMPADLFPNEDARKSYVAEALFVRAYAYFYMIRIWGDPVYVTEMYDDVDYGNIPPLARTPEAQVLDSCIADLKLSSAALSYSGGNLSKVIKANKGAAYALMAHIYAWKHDYVNAHLACQEVITNGGYTLEPMSNYKNIWSGQMSRENIMELSMKAMGNTIEEASFGFFAVFLRGSYVDNNKSNSWVSPKDGFVDQYYDHNLDLRYKAILAPVNASGTSNDGYLLTKYTSFEYQAPDTKTGPYLNNNLVLFRLSDIILLDAEARAFTGDLDGAKEMLALTEDRAGINSYQGLTTEYDIVEEVIKERGRELIGEGNWYYDLIRTNEKHGWLEDVGYPGNGRLSLQNKGYYWPLNMAKLFPQNKLLTQNPWWAANK